MSLFKSPCKAILFGGIVILVGVIIGIIVVMATGHGTTPATPLQKLQHDGYTQAPGIDNPGESDIGINGAGRAEWASQGCQGEDGFKQAIASLHDNGKVSVNCSQGFLVVNADTTGDLLNFASSLGV